jgi:hypothetical protein
VKKMSGLTGDGAGLMGNAFKDDEWALVLADLTTQTGKDIQAGYRFLFMSSQQAIRNPAARSWIEGARFGGAVHLPSNVDRLLDANGDVPMGYGMPVPPPEDLSTKPSVSGVQSSSSSA